MWIKRVRALIDEKQRNKDNNWEEILRVETITKWREMLSSLLLDRMGKIFRKRYKRNWYSTRSTAFKQYTQYSLNIYPHYVHT